MIAMRSRCVLLAVLLLPFLGPALPAAAAPCTASISGPSDPGYAPAERAPQDPQESFNTEQWYLYDCIPQSAPLAVDATGSAGMRVNQAWKDFGYGEDSVLVAYMEGGINWERADTAPELRKRSWLNTRELPKPRRADGTTATSYDLNGDGVVDVDDYKDDPRIKRPLLHPTTAGGITPEDLIVAFSDRTDADGNGYVDDIAGWNFHRDTNDPQTDQTKYNHANSEMALAVGEKDNGVGGSGMCPRCRLLPVKIGDEAIDRTDRVAQGIVFAVDSGAKVIVGVSVSLGETPELGAAFRYAYERGAVVAWASNDFESADHTDGMLFDHVWPGNGLVADRTNRQSTALPNDRLAQTFRARSTVTSYGPHNLFSVASKNGSTSASTPGQGGVAALVYSAGVDAVRRGVLSRGLDADEVKQVLRSTVTDIATTPVSTAGEMFPAQPGFDIQYGYGRPDVHAAMAMVRQGRIPPTADLRTPRWYASVDPTRQRSVRITAGLAARRSGRFTWEVQYGLGPQPLSFTTIAAGAGSTARSVSADLDLSRIPRSHWDGSFAVTADRLSIERYDVTIRVVVRDAQGLVGEDRKAIVVRHDSSELPGFPRDLGQGGEPQPTVADLDGDGRLEVVTASADGTVRALRPDGRALPGFPVRTRTAPAFDVAPYTSGVSYARARGWRSLPRPRDPIATTPAVGDLDHDGGQDVVVATTNGRVYAWDGLGRLRKGFPVQTDRRFARQAVPVPLTPYTRNRSAGAFGSPVLADLDGDRDLEVVLGDWDGRVYAWTSTGALLKGWPADTENPDKSVPPGFVYARDYKVATTPAIADVDGDGQQDVVVALADTSFPDPVNEGPVTGYVTAFRGSGQRVDGYPVRIPALVQGYGTAQDFVTEGVQTPAVFDGPTGPVLVANAGLAPAVTVDLRTRTVTPLVPPVFAPGGRGQSASPLVHFTTSASLGRLVPGTPGPQVAQAGSAATDVATAVVATPGLGIRVRAGLTAYDPTAHAPLPAFAVPKVLQGLPFLSAPAVADVSGDGRPDVLIATDSAALHAFDGLTGAEVPGFPKWTGGWVLYTPTVADLDDDGKVEVIAQTREGYLHAWRTAGLATANVEAWHYHQDERNTGHYGTDTRPPAGVRDLRVSGSRLSFTAPGDDGNTGTAARYEVYGSDRPITQDTLRSSRRLSVTVAPRPAGARVTAQVPAARYYAVRAVDDVGNLGPVPVRAARESRPATSGRLPSTGGSGGLPAVALTCVLLGLLARAARQRHRPVRR
jgi:hypothetical protein